MITDKDLKNMEDGKKILFKILKQLGEAKGDTRPYKYAVLSNTLNDKDRMIMRFISRNSYFMDNNDTDKFDRIIEFYKQINNLFDEFMKQENIEEKE